MGKLQRGRKSGSINGEIIVPFNIEAIPAEDREPLLADTRRLRDGLIQVAHTLLDAGESFTRWKERLPHGTYLSWVATTGYSDQSARNARNVYKRFRDQPLLFQDLDLAIPETAIVDLATAPDTALEDVIDRVREGEDLDLKIVQAIVRQHKSAYDPKPDSPKEAGKTASDSLGAAGLRRMAKEAHDELATQIEGRLMELLHFIHDAEARLPTKQRLSLEALQKAMRPRAQWLTEALEQHTQRRALSSVKLRYETSLFRAGYPPGPWADAAKFLRDVGHSHGWDMRITTARVPELLRLGRLVLEAVLPKEKHRHFTQT